MVRRVLPIVSSLILAARVEASDTAESIVVDEDEPLLGTLDIIVLALAGFGAVYYFFFRKKPATVNTNQYIIQQTTVPTAGSAGSASGFLEKMKKSNRRMVVFYGSQTGTAEEFAGRLAKEGIRYGMRGVVADPEECEMEDLAELASLEEDLDGPVLAVFCVATYGEGDPTDNAQAFYEWLQDGSANVNGLRYAVFGLGNSTYEHFNEFGKCVDKKLAEMGGKRVHALGLGDDDVNIEDDFVQWKDAFWTSVCAEFGLEFLGDNFSMRQYESTVFGPDNKPERIYTGEVARIKSYETQRPPFDAKNPYLADIVENRNLHADTSDRYCMHVELSLGESRIRYDAGDHVAIYPTNNVALVERLGELLSVDLDTVFTMRALDEDATKKSPFPVPTTFRTALLHYVDITALPRTHVLHELAEYTADEGQKSRLRSMASGSPEGRALYQSFVVDACRHVTHILEAMDTCKPAVDHLLELLPRLQPRFYSISSSSRVHPAAVHVTAVVVEYETNAGHTNHGVCTTWLKPMVPDHEKQIYSRVPVYVRRSQFRLPNRVQTPVIMIGPGTGLAPFRGFIQERAWQKEQGKPVGETHLYFGCRNKDKDFIYREELEKFAESGVIRLHTAFSRDQPEKVYVTHRMREHFDDLWRMIGKEGGHVYICGDAKMMAKDVHNIIVEVVQNGAQITNEEAEKYVKKMEQQKRYSADVWS